MGTISLLNHDFSFINPFLSAKKIVIKLGSSLVTNPNLTTNTYLLTSLAKQITQLQEKNIAIVIVSSGAIASGLHVQGLSHRPNNIHDLQASAAIGQMHLMQVYKNIFDTLNLKSGQILLNHADFADRERYLNAKATLHYLLQRKIIPIINENDAIVNDEIRFGDNDTLGALVANLIDADILCILTDQSGIYDADPRKNPNANLIQYAVAQNENLTKFAGAAGTNVGTGGMLTKVLAARRCSQGGIHTCIAYGRQENILLDLFNGKNYGSLLFAHQNKTSARKQWMKDHLKMSGHINIDEGALAALHKGKSLLAIGINAVHGNFVRGDVIACYCNGAEIARGIAQYSSFEAQLISKHASKSIKDILGYCYADELIHRNDLVMI